MPTDPVLAMSKAPVSAELADKAEGLPFDPAQQLAILGFGLTNQNFLKQVKNQLPWQWFTDSQVGKCWDLLVKYYDQYSFPRSAEALESSGDFAVMDLKLKLSLTKVMAVARLKCTFYSIEELADQLTTWKRYQIFHRDIPKIAGLLNARPRAQIDKAIQLYKESAEEVSTTQFNAATRAEFTDWKKTLAESEYDVDKALTTGVTVLDRHLLPEGKGGSLLPGDTTVIVAPTNAGKTSAMITIARHNIVAGKDILFIAREGRESDIQQKIFQSMLRKSREELRLFVKTAEGDAYMDKMAGALDAKLDYIHMPKVSQTVEDAVSTVLMMQANRKAKTGKGYDMLVVDYPGIFSAAAADGARWEFRQIQDYIYRQFVQLGLEEKFHVLVAAQTNREGSKINRGQGTKRLLSVEDIAEAFGICMSATNVLTLNRSTKAAAENRLTFYVVKSRSSETGWAVTCRSDYSRCMTHGNELGATAVRGEASNDDIIDALLKQYPNRDIPAGYVIKRSMEVGEAKM